MNSMVSTAEGVGARITNVFKGVAASSFAIAKGMGIVLAGAGAIAAYSLKAASDLEFQLNLLQTHAAFASGTADIAAFKAQQAALGNVMDDTSAAAAYAKQQVDLLRRGFETLGPQVGFTATQLAEAAYFASSEGVQFRNAAGMLDLMSAAAKTAQMTHSDLAATTKTLAQIMGVLGNAFSDPNKAAGELNAIVGQGVMTMDQFNASLRTGFLGVTGIVNQSLSEMGGALDVLTTGAYGASNATTSLRYLLIALANQSKTHSDAFKALGLDQATFVNNMVNDPMGFIHGLELLQTKLEALPGGLKGAASLNIIEKLFGGVRGFAGGVTLFEFLPKWKQAIKDIEDNANTFNQKWAQTAKQPTVMFQMLHAAIYSLRVALGEALLPMFIALLTVLTPIVLKVGDWINNNQKLIETWAPLIFKILAFGTAFFLATGIVAKFFSYLSPLKLLLLGVGAVILFVAQHWAQWGPAIMGVVNTIANALKPVLHWLADFFSGPVVSGISRFGGFITSTLTPAFKEAWPHIKDFGKAIADAMPHILHFIGVIGRDLVTVLSKVPWGKLFDGLKTVWDAFVGALPDIEKFLKMLIGAIGQVIPFVFGIIHVLAGFVAGVMKYVIQPLMNVAGWLQEHFHLITIIIDAMIARWVLTKLFNPFLGAISGAKELITHLTNIRGLQELALGRELQAKLFGGSYPAVVGGQQVMRKERGLFPTKIATEDPLLVEASRMKAITQFDTKVGAIFSRLTTGAQALGRELVKPFATLAERAPLFLSKVAFASGAILTNLTERVPLFLSKVAYASGAILNNITEFFDKGQRGSAVLGTMQSSVDDLATTIDTRFAMAGESAGRMWITINDTASTGLTKLSDLTKTSASRIEDVFTRMTGPLTRTFSRLATMAAPAIGALSLGFQGLALTISTRFGSALDAIGLRLSSWALTAGSILTKFTSGTGTLPGFDTSSLDAAGTKAAKNFVDTVTKANVGKTVVNELTNSVSKSNLAEILTTKFVQANAGKTLVDSIENAVSHSNVLTNLLGASGKVLKGAGGVAKLLAQPVFIMGQAAPLSVIGLGGPGGTPVAPVSGEKPSPASDAAAGASAGWFTKITGLTVKAGSIITALAFLAGEGSSQGPVIDQIYRDLSNAETHARGVEGSLGLYASAVQGGSQGIQDRMSDMQQIFTQMSGGVGRSDVGIEFLTQLISAGAITTAPQMQQFFDNWVRITNAQNGMIPNIQQIIASMHLSASDLTKFTNVNSDLAALMTDQGPKAEGYLTDLEHSLMLSGKNFGQASAMTNAIRQTIAQYGPLTSNQIIGIYDALKNGLTNANDIALSLLTINGDMTAYEQMMRDIFSGGVINPNTGKEIKPGFGHARGGPVSSHTPYLVGEAGWELFKPDASAYAPIMLGTAGPSLFRPAVSGTIIPHERSVTEFWKLREMHPTAPNPDRLMPGDMGTIIALSGATPMMAGGHVAESMSMVPQRAHAGATVSVRSFNAPTERSPVANNAGGIEGLQSTLDAICNVLTKSFELQSKQPAPGDQVTGSPGFRSTATGLEGLLYTMNQKAARSRARGIRSERFG